MGKRPPLSDDELNELARQAAADYGEVWVPVLQMIHDPAGAWVSFRHRDNSLNPIDFPDSIFIDRSDGLRVTLSSLHALHSRQGEGWRTVLGQWRVANPASFDAFLRGDWDADPAWRDAYFCAVLRSAHRRYESLKIVFPANALPEDQIRLSHEPAYSAPRDLNVALGPFAGLFESSPQASSGLKSLLHLSKGADAMLENVRVATEAPEAPRFVKALFDELGWWPGFVAGVAYLWDPRGRFDRRWLWEAIDSGSWAIPQLLTIAFLTDVHFVARAKRRLDEGAWVRYDRPITLEPYEVEPLGDPPERSSKLAASLLAIAELSPGLSPGIPRWRADQRITDLLAEDALYDGSPAIVNGWLAAVTKLFAQRGIGLNAADTAPASAISRLWERIEGRAWANTLRRAIVNARLGNDGNE